MPRATRYPDASLPPGFESLEVLADRPGCRVVRARRRDGSGDASADWVVRCEAGRAEGLAELAVLGLPEHPGLAPPLEHGPLDGGGLWVARPWIAGQPLTTWSRDRPAGSRPSDREIGVVVARLTDALQHLHRHGIVHGDLKPENVIVGPDAQPVLCDFGLSRPAGSATAEGARGTYFAIAPEELYGLETTPRSDLFALGALLVRLLAAPTCSAREFYARFPDSSFLDASGVDPERLPAWARDLVVAATARDPGRRPSSAAWLGRRLAERLELDWTPESVEALGWPVERGRERWFADRRTQDGEKATWIVVPEQEDAREIWNRLRLHAALRGHLSQGIDLDAALVDLADGVALDRWIGELARKPGERWFVLAERSGAWTERALAGIARSLAAAGVPLSVVSRAAPPADGWRAERVPAIEPAAVLRFATETFAAESEERQSAFVEGLLIAAEGSARLLDAAFRRLVADGAIISDGEAYRLRPGPLPVLSPEPASVSADSSDASRLASAIHVEGEPARLERVGALLGWEPRRLALALAEAREAGWVVLRGEVLVRRPRAPLVAVPDLRRLHAAAADSGPPTERALHALCAEPTLEHAEAWLAFVREERERGRGEQALARLERLTALGAALGLDLVRTLPDLPLETALAWCSIGLPEPAAALAAQQEEGAAVPPELAAGWELARARIAVLRHETEEALASYARCAALAPSRRAEAESGRVHLLHTAGRDREVLAAVAALDPEGLEQRGELPRRLRLFVRSLEAMSRFRLGQRDEARAATSALLDEAVELGDVGLEAALHINRAIQERQAGSLPRAHAELTTAIERYRAAGLVFGLAQARTTLGGVLRELGRLREAEEVLGQAIETRERLGDRDGANTARGTLGLLMFERGHARAAIEALESSAAAMTGAQRRRFAPLLLAKAYEMRVRIGERPEVPDASEESWSADPRILVALARSAWLLGDADEARTLAERGRDLARSLKLERLVAEAHALVERIAGVASEMPSALGPGSSGGADLETLRLLSAADADLDALVAQAEAQEKSGRDDRAARLFLALAARSPDLELAERARERSHDALSRATAGLGEQESAAFVLALLGEPDPRSADHTKRPTLNPDEDLEMEIQALLEINEKLVDQTDLESLVDAILEVVMGVTGAERGFLVLEEHGELRFDTALDSVRGDIAQPEFEVSRTVVNEALAHMRPVRVKNAVDDPLFAHQGSVVTLELRSILCVPLAIEPGLRGAIYLDHRLRNAAFDGRAEKLAQLLASQAALAIQKTKRVDEVRRLNRELERRVIASEADLSRARERLAGTREETLLVGDSEEMRATRAWIAKAAPTELSVLVVGESGTGKELAARSLHLLSPRQAGPFVSESCAAFPASLIESELFGYRRGAFTGADRDRAGLLEQADGGTLFLDEIGELPLELQAKLLRVLETGEVRRLGAEDARKVDFRLVVATNRDLEEEVRTGRFRRDLYYRLEGLRITMPTLAERPEDVVTLVRHFMERAGEERRLGRKVAAALVRRAWPGNVRELRNEVSRLCVLSEGDLDDPSLVSTPAAFETTRAGGSVVPLAELERKAIEQAIEHAGGDKARAAELLGISRAKIYQRLRDWREEG